jgi:hypothetical protein
MYSLGVLLLSTNNKKYSHDKTFCSRQIWRACGRGSSEHLAATLRASMAAAQAAHALVEAPGLHSAAAADAARALAELLDWESGRSAAVCSLSNVLGALSRLLDLVRVRIFDITLSHKR